MLDGFKQFVLRGNVIDLAVGVIIGAAFTNIVNALVKDILTPFLSLIGGQPDFSGLSFQLGRSHFLVGDFLNAVLAFAINAAVIYFAIVMPIHRLAMLGRRSRQTNDPTTKKCPECLSEIPLTARRCAYCTTKLDG
jgi:large conductance mechanosensitive channel